MNKFIFLPLALLTGCGAGGFPDVQYATAGACATPYYREVLGVYTGTLERDGAAYFVDLQVTGEDDLGLCNMRFDAVTTNQSLNGNFMTMVDPDGNQDFWQNPVYPVDGLGQANSLTATDGVIGLAGSNVFRVTFNGYGGLTIADTFGELRKQ